MPISSSSFQMSFTPSTAMISCTSSSVTLLVNALVVSMLLAHRSMCELLLGTNTSASSTDRIERCRPVSSSCILVSFVLRPLLSASISLSIFLELDLLLLFLSFPFPVFAVVFVADPLASSSSSRSSNSAMRTLSLLLCSICSRMVVKTDAGI